MKPVLIVLTIIFIGCASSSKWLFSDPPSTMVATQRLVIEKKNPVLFIFHDKDGDWQFLANEKARVDQVVELSLSDIVALDSSIIQVGQLKRGWKACRTDSKSPWNISLYR